MEVNLSDIKKCTPEERLRELERLYNSQEGERFTLECILKMKSWIDEMNFIIKENPDLVPGELKTYYA